MAMCCPTREMRLPTVCYIGLAAKRRNPPQRVASDGRALRVLVACLPSLGRRQPINASAWGRPLGGPQQPDARPYRPRAVLYRRGRMVLLHVSSRDAEDAAKRFEFGIEA